ncbi:MAG: LamG-like jellyroll fold domain-containing protein, partial [Flavobacteriaceae bacterium]
MKHLLILLLIPILGFSQTSRGVKHITEAAGGNVSSVSISTSTQSSGTLTIDKISLSVGQFFLGIDNDPLSNPASFTLNYSMDYQRDFGYPWGVLYQYNTFSDQYLTISKGYYSDKVKLNWQILANSSAIDAIKIYRTTDIDSEVPAWGTPIASLGSEATTYEDTDIDGGVLYRYKIQVHDNENGIQVDSEYIGFITGVGFRNPTGIITGGVEYKGGTPVKGVTITASADGVTTSAGNSVLIPDENHVLIENFHENIANELSIQSWIKPQFAFNENFLRVFKLKSDGGEILEGRLTVKSNNILEIQIGSTSMTLESFIPSGKINNKGDDILIPINQLNQQFNHFSFVIKDNETPRYFINGREINSDFVIKMNAIKEPNDPEIVLNTTTSTLSISTNSNGNGQKWIQAQIGGELAAYFDEFRLWDTSLEPEDIYNNYKGYLRGNETGLHSYLRFDEGAGKVAYDLSYVRFDFNKNNGVFSNTISSSISWGIGAENIPRADQLGITGVTDENGNYIIASIPYGGSGETFRITPSLGVHEFSPSQEIVYVGVGNEVTNNVDFEDISSFNFNGRVLYDSRGVFPPGPSDDDIVGDIGLDEAYNAYTYNNVNYPYGEYWLENTFGGTESSTIETVEKRLRRYAPIPLQGANVYIDNQIVLDENNLPVESDNFGRFSIEVPIGRHTVSVRKSNHDFLHGGYFPKRDSIVEYGDVRYEYNYHDFFEDNDSEIVFIDNTKVNVVGRVVGGTYESEKPIGFGFDGPKTFQVSSTADPIVYTSNNNIGTASITLGYRGPGATTITNEFKTTIGTNSQTAEFRVALLPLVYELNQNDLVIESQVSSNQRFLSSGEILNFSSITPERNSYYIYEEDTISTSLPYNYVKKFTFRSDPSVAVLEQQFDNEIELEGRSYTVTSTTAGSSLIAFYKQGFKYSIELQKQEQYYNYEKPSDEQLSIVPVNDGEIVITNNLADTRQGGQIQSVNPNDESKITYSFIAGLPNVDVGQNFLSTMSIIYRLDGNDYQVSNYISPGIILGSKDAGGTTFSTAGPEIPDIILRDPPGSESSATIESGSVISISKQLNLGSSVGVDFSIGAKAGLKQGAGGGLAGPFFETETYSQNTFGLAVGFGTNNGTDLTQTYTFNQSISTSNDPDWVGSDADIYIGTSSNQYYGLMYNIKPTTSEILDPSDNSQLSIPITVVSGSSTSTIYITKQKALFFTPGEDKTVFNYSQWQILNEIIPEYQEFYDNYDCIVNNDPDCPITVSGGLKPKMWYSSQINLWKRVILLNESQKYKAHNDKTSLKSEILTRIEDFRDLAGNPTASYTKLKQLLENTFSEVISFDAGVGSISRSIDTQKSDTNEFTFNFDINTSFASENLIDVSGTGLIVNFSLDAGFTTEQTITDTQESNLTVSYDLVDNDDYNKLSVDVINAVDGNGPIFITKGGETSCPVEGASLSYFFNPTTQIVSNTSTATIEFLEENERVELSRATVAIEDPFISAESLSVTGVPSEDAAEFILTLRNNSILEAEESDFILYLDQTTNPDNAIVNLDPVGTPFYLTGGESVQYTLTVKKGSNSVFDYNNLKIVFESACDDDLSQSILISAGFLESCSKVTLAEPSNNWVKNIENTSPGGTPAPLDIKLTEFDSDFEGLEKIILEYRASGSPTWIKLQTYTSSDTVYNELVAGGETAVTSFTTNINELTYNWDIVTTGISDGDYELRATSFCVNGTEYESKIISGKVDLNSPVLFGTPQPTDGILSIGEDLMVRFSEDVKSNSTLTRYDVLVQKNQLPVEHEISLAFNGSNNKGVIENPYLKNSSISFEFWLKNTTNSLGYLLNQSEGLGIKISNNQIIYELNSANSISAPISTDGSYHHYTLSYNYETGTAQIIEDDNVVRSQTLAANIQLENNNELVIGESSFSGNIHDLRIWNTVISRETSIANKNKLFNGNERDLYGYWPMDEGIGSLAKDKARLKHIQLTNVDWDIFPKGTAYNFNGSSYLRLNQSSKVVITKDMDATISFWMKTSQAGGTLFSNGYGDNTDDVMANGYRNKWAIGLNGSGKLALNAENESYLFSDTPLNDNSWHHISMVLRRNGNLTMRVDGGLTNSYAVGDIGGFSGSTIFIGAKGKIDGNSNVTVTNHYNGLIDELRIWNVARNSIQINGDQYHEIDPQTLGLILYLPFNAPAQANSNGPKYYYPYNSLQNYSDYAVMSTASTSFSNITPAITAMRPTERLIVDGVINADQILLQPRITDWASIEEKIAYVTVANIYDMADNRIESPVTWTAFVNKNPLSFFMEGEDKSIVFEKPVGEAAEVEFTLVNRSGIQQQYSVITPSWMTLDAPSGTIGPNSTIKLLATINENISPGIYDEDIIVTNPGFNFDIKLLFNLRVTANEPEWDFDPNQYAHSMTIVGKINIEGRYSIDTFDKVIAKFEEETRGIAQISYDNDYDDYFVLLTVYGNPTAVENITFEIWDASEGRVKNATIDGNESQLFTSNAILGNYQTPVVFSNTNGETQYFDLNRGWTWVSFNVEDVDFNDLDALFENLNLNTSDQIKSISQFDNYEENLANSSLSGWDGSISNGGGLSTGVMYKIKMAEAQRWSITGPKVDLSSWTYNITSGWNWLPYVVSKNVSINDALANYNPSPGDLIKSQTQFAIFDANLNRWKGSLSFMFQGEGYMLYSSNGNNNFTYP